MEKTMYVGLVVGAWLFGSIFVFNAKKWKLKKRKLLSL